jgi:cell division protein FtsI (penicillin-binding protein 3)
VGLLWAVLILLRLVYLQVAGHAAYQSLADQQQQRTIRIDAARGAIFDRSGRPLALSVPADSVCINPLRIPDPVVAAGLLSGALGVDRDSLLERIQGAVDYHKRMGKQAKGAGFLWVKRKITPEESERLRSLKLDWVEFRQESQRYYPDGSLASHLVGTVDFQEKGNLGLEQSLDSALRGRPGMVRMLTDVQQRGIESLTPNSAQPGTSVTVSIDEHIQFIVERELNAACELHRAYSGSAIVMNPYTGEILAMASYPPFDPARQPSKNDDPSARFNHPVSVAFEPGSVFKIITLSAALETTKLRPTSMINCGNGTINLYGRVIHEAHRGYGTISMADVLAHSSNIGAIQIGLRVGERNLLDYIRRFGFGQKTGIPLPAESAGCVRDLKHWGKTSIGSVAMGHEVSTTSLQLAQACSIIANGGVLVRPRLIVGRQRPGEKPGNEPIAPNVRVIQPETAIAMRQMMEGVILFGTGKGLRPPGYTAGGKTGSAQIFDLVTKKYTHMYNGSFVGFAPVTNPAVVVAVTLNGTKQYGGVVAGPVFKAVMNEVLRLLDVPRDLPETLPSPSPDSSEQDDVSIADMATPTDDLQPVGLAPDLTASSGQAADPVVQTAAPTIIPTGPPVPSFHGKTLRAVLAQSVANGIPVDVIGSGIARAQIPPPGAFLNPGERVRVQFQ